MNTRQATENGDVAALERAWDETGQNANADRYIRNADATHQVEAIEVLIDDGVRRYLLSDLREGRYEGAVKRPRSISIVAQVRDNDATFQAVVPARVAPRTRDRDMYEMHKLSVFVILDADITAEEVADTLRAAYFHPSVEDREGIDAERREFDEIALRAAKRALGQGEPGAIDVRVRITDAATGWIAEATARPIDGDNDSHATRTGSTRASAAEAALRAAIDNSDMREYGTVLR